MTPSTFLSRRANKIYQAIWERLVSHCLTHGLDPCHLTAKQVSDYLASRSVGLKHSTMALELSGIRAYYHGAILNGLRQDNPTAGMRMPKKEMAQEDSVLIRSMGPDDARQFLAHVATITPRDRLLVLLMLGCGLRVAECCALKWDHISLDLTHATITGKGGKTRYMGFPAPVIKSLEEWAYQNPQRLAHELVFGFCTQTARNIVNRILTDCGLKRKGISCHGLRHSYAMLATLGGCPVEVLSGSMGHASTTTTDIYKRSAARYQGNPSDYAMSYLDNLPSKKQITGEP